MEEIKMAEKVAREFLDEKFNIPNPKPERLDTMVRIVLSKNGTMTLDELFFKVKEVLKKRGLPNPEKDRIINWMLAIAINNSGNPPKGIVGIIPTEVYTGIGMRVNY